MVLKKILWDILWNQDLWFSSPTKFVGRARGCQGGLKKDSNSWTELIWLLYMIWFTLTPGISKKRILSALSSHLLTRFGCSRNLLNIVMWIIVEILIKILWSKSKNKLDLESVGSLGPGLFFFFFLYTLYFLGMWG